MIRPRAVVFDLDGTVVDNMALHAEAFAEFARRLPAHYLEVPFPTTPGTSVAIIDPSTGYLVTEGCPSSFEEAFVAGTEPTTRCPMHGGRDIEREPPGEGVGVPF